MKQHPYSPCMFYGELIEGEPPIYLGIYVDDFIYFSESKDVKKKFEELFGNEIPMEFNGPVSYFLGVNFTHTCHADGNVSILMSQEAFIEALVAHAGLDGEGVNIPQSPYRSGLPVDKIKIENYDEITQHKITSLLQSLVGSLNWLSVATRPDIATITNMLAQYSNTKASRGHIDQAKRVIKYLKGTKSKGILFSSRKHSKLESFVNFPISNNKVTGLTDANWGPQDQSTPSATSTLPLEELEIFKSHSMSGYILWLNGPIHWSSRRQTITAWSSAEAEIYATDECTKQLIHLSYILEGFKLIEETMPTPTPVYNDNMACVNWSKTTTTKGLRHVQIRENAIREAVATNFITVQHVEGKFNLADIFTKEDKDVEHFIEIRDCLLSDLPHEEI